MSVLPVGKIPATRINPRILILYGPPKVGKTEILTQLDSCLILDTEKGAEMYEASRVTINSVAGLRVTKSKMTKEAGTVYYQGVGTQQSIFKKLEDGSEQLVSTSLKQVRDDLYENAKQQKLANPDKPAVPPYKYLAIDTVDELETMVELIASDAYHNSTIGKNFEGNSVLELPKGLGYWYLREEMVNQINQLTVLCETVILIAHVKDKLLDSKGGIDVTSKDISLTGKLSGIICAKADAIGYLYRDPGDKKLWVNFETLENNPTMGTRFKRLAGQRFAFEWSKIFI